MRVVYDNLEDKESEYAKSVLSDINEMNEAVKSQEEAQGIYARNVGDYYRDLSKSTNKTKETVEGTNKVTSALAGTFGSLGVQSKIAESGIKGMTIAQTGLEGATKLLNSVAEAGGIQAAANHVMDILREKQQQRLAAATAAQTAAQNANNIATKAAAVATYLWNAALAANPILLIVTAVAALAVGIGFLIKKISDNEKAQKNINKAMEDYERLGREREKTDQKIANSAAETARVLQESTDKEINAAKLRGASARELQIIQEKANIAKIKSEAETARQSLAAAKSELAGKTKVIQTLEKNGKKLSDEQKEQLKGYKEAVADLSVQIEGLDTSAKAFPQALKNAETEALVNAKEYSKERARIAKDVEKVIEDVAVAGIENQQKRAVEARRLAAKREIDEIKANENYTASQKKQLIIASEKSLKKDIAEIEATNAREEFNRRAKAIEDKLKLEVEQQKALNGDVEKMEVDAENVRYANILKANDMQVSDKKLTQLELENLENEHIAKINEIKTKAEKDRQNIERLAVENTYAERRNALIQAQAGESEFTRLHLEQLNEQRANLKQEDFKNEEEYKSAVLELDKNITEEQLSLIQQVADSQAAQLSAFGELFGTTSDLLNELGGEMGAFGNFSKALAMTEIMINMAKGIAGAISGAMTLAPPANIAAAAAGIAAVTAGIASAKKVLNSSGNVPKYAHGGFVSGSSKSGDKVPIMANSGELVLNAEQQRIFEVIGNQNTTIDYELMYGAFSRAIGEMKPPTMVYSEFVDFQNNLATFDENSKIKM